MPPPKSAARSPRRGELLEDDQKRREYPSMVYEPRSRRSAKQGSTRSTPSSATASIRELQPNRPTAPPSPAACPSTSPPIARPCPDVDAFVKDPAPAPTSASSTAWSPLRLRRTLGRLARPRRYERRFRGYADDPSRSIWAFRDYVSRSSTPTSP